MFRRKESLAKKKFSQKTRIRRFDPQTVVLLQQLMVGAVSLSVLGLVVTGVWYGTRATVVTINDIVVTSKTTIDHQTVTQIVTDTLSGTYSGVIPRRFTWLFPYGDIVSNLAHIPRLKDPVVIREGTRLLVSFDEYIPAALWCNKHTDNQCVFVDERGYAYTEAPPLQGSAFLRFYTQGTTTATGTTLMDITDFGTLRQLAATITDQYKLPITKIEIDMVRDAFFTISGGGELRLSLRQLAAETISNLDTILVSKDFSDIQPGSFQYIDLRFGNKVFVNEESGSATSTGTSTDIVLPTLTGSEFGSTNNATDTGVE